MCTKWPKLPFCMHTQVLSFYASNLITVYIQNIHQFHLHFCEGWQSQVAAGNCNEYSLNLKFLHILIKTLQLSFAHCDTQTIEPSRFKFTTLFSRSYSPLYQTMQQFYNVRDKLICPSLKPNIPCRGLNKL